MWDFSKSFPERGEVTGEEQGPALSSARARADVELGRTARV